MLQGRTYVPMLHARLAEMRALSELPSATKNKLFPIIKARPWLNARELTACWNKIHEALGERSFALDLDSTKNRPGDAKPAYQEFSRLFLPDNSHENYYRLVETLPHATPMLQISADQVLNLEGQLDFVEQIGRGLVIRGRPLSLVNYRDLALAVTERGMENVIFALDCGWGRDILSQAAICVAQVERILDVNDEIEVVIGGSSFPVSFANQGERIQIPMIERSLFQEVRRNVNRGILIYGDWGSTRPPSDPVPMRNIARIDFAMPTRWVSHRDDGTETYASIAQNVLNDADFDNEFGIWAEYMIESTAAGLEPAIRSPAMAAAVRVNMHLHVQANLDDPGAMAAGDEPFIDI